MTFTGFTDECLRFVAENHLQNNTEWFHANRQVYDEVLMPQLKALVSNLAPYMLSIDPDMEITPKVGKTIGRINRDVRFSRDKSIYNDHVWIKFHPQGKEKENTIGFYFGFHPDTYGTGMGMSNLKDEFMIPFRKKLKQDAQGFLDVLKTAYPDKGFEIGSDSYKKIRDPEVPRELQSWSQFKQFWLHQSLKIDDVFLGTGLVNWIQGEFEKLKPLYLYLKEIKSRHA